MLGAFVWAEHNNMVVDRSVGRATLSSEVTGYNGQRHFKRCVRKPVDTGTWNSAVKKQTYGVIILDLDSNGLIHSNQSQLSLLDQSRVGKM